VYAFKANRINIIAETDGLLKINREALLAFNMLGDVMCATLHNNTVVKRGQTVAGTKALPLIVKKDVVRSAIRIAEQSGKIIHIKGIKQPKAGVVITGNEVFYGVIKDAFARVITEKIEAVGGEIVGTYYAPDDESFITSRLRELINAGANILITTGGMSVDPDDVTRFAIKNLGASDIVYGSAVLPGAMFLVAYMEGGISTSDSEATEPGLPIPIPILGIPACGIYAKTTIFDLILPKVLAGERIDRKELAELGHGGLCMKCETCNYPVCPFGK
jgi:molybdopterin biosynthesis enzyme